MALVVVVTPLPIALDRSISRSDGGGGVGGRSYKCELKGWQQQRVVGGEGCMMGETPRETASAAAVRRPFFLPLLRRAPHCFLFLFLTRAVLRASMQWHKPQRGRRRLR